MLSLNPEIDADIPALIGASAALSLVRHAVQGPDRRRARRLQRRPVRAEPDRAASCRASKLRPRRRRHRRRGADGRVRSRGAVRRRDARRRGVRPRADAGRDQGDQRAGRRGRQADVGLEAAARQTPRSTPPSPRTPRRRCREAYQITEKQARYATHRRDQGRRDRGAGRRRSAEVRRADERRRIRCSSSSSNIVRSRILDGEPRIDGRDMRHRAPDHRRRSACCRAPTARRCSRAARRRRWSTTTLGTGRDAQIIDALAGEHSEPFMLHYNFPPFSRRRDRHDGLAEAPRNRPRQPGPPRHQRRDAGHGRHSRTSSASSRRSSSRTARSSMASVCGTSLR